MSKDTLLPVDVVKAFMAAMAELDYDTAMSYVSDDCEYVNVPIATVRGPAGIRGVLEPFFAPTLENEWIIRATAADGPVVFMERLDRHRLRNGWTELPVTGVFEVHDGRITAWRDYFDLATLQTGFARSPESVRRLRPRPTGASTHGALKRLSNVRAIPVLLHGEQRHVAHHLQRVHGVHVVVAVHVAEGMAGHGRLHLRAAGVLGDGEGGHVAEDLQGVHRVAVAVAVHVSLYQLVPGRASWGR
jgi:limonene-1,2-epoxide hydrolase